MLLGIILHACAAFSADTPWLVTFKVPLPWAQTLNDVIHAFRMPSFFMVSGFFAYYILCKKVPSSINSFLFYRTKLIRIAIPLLCVMVIANVPQNYLLNLLLYHEDLGVSRAGSLRGHLWFLVTLLVYLLIYSLVHVFVHSVVEKIKTHSLQPTRGLLNWVVLGLCLIAPILHLALLALHKTGIDIYQVRGIFGSLYKLFAYFHYFLLGVAFAIIGQQRIVNILCMNSKNANGLYIFLPLFIISIVPYVLPGFINTVSGAYISQLQVILICLFIWLTAEKLFSSTGMMMRKVADASYTIYLFHHPLIVLLVLGFNVVFTSMHISDASSAVQNIVAYITFMLVVVFSFVFTYYLHHWVIRRHWLLSGIFNGKFKTT